MALLRVVCTNCGFWQETFAGQDPVTCPVCSDFRHTPPESGWEWWEAETVAQKIACRWRQDQHGVVTFWNEPRLGTIGPNSYLIPHSTGNCLFEATGWYSPEALEFIAARGGVRWLSASHPHAYGALWQLQERFPKAKVVIAVDDLPWTGTFAVSHPFEERLVLAPGLELHQVGGHFAGQSVLWWSDRKLLWAGDALKGHFAEGHFAGLSMHKAFNRRIPLSHGEVRRYQAVFAVLPFQETYTTFEHVAEGSRARALELCTAQLSGAPFFGPLTTSSNGLALAVYRTTMEGLLKEPGTVVHEFPLSPVDRLGLPLWTVAVVGADGALSDGFGYGPTLEAAQASAWGETVEWAWARASLRSRTPLRGTWGQLHRAGEPVVDPVRCNLSAGSTYDPEGTELRWLEARRHPTGERVLLPAEFIAPRFADLGPDFDTTQALAVPITNGLGAGPTYAHALAHGVLELLQRDGNSVSYRALDRGVRVELDAVTNEETRALLRHLDEEADIEVIVKLAALDFGLPNLYVVGYDRDPTRAAQPIMLSACGEAVHPDREVALAKALREFVSARARKAFNHGPLSLVRSVAPTAYLAAFAEGAARRSEDERALREMQGWARLSHEAFFRLLQPVYAVRQTVRFSELPSTPVPDAESLLELLTTRLSAEGLEILWADFTPPGVPATVGKAIVPGLEVETMTYQRVGIRNLRRLLSIGSPLVGLGEPPSGALSIRLTPEAIAALPGGAAWFSPAALQSAVGDLYPLYREPGRHVVGLLAES